MFIVEKCIYRQEQLIKLTILLKNKLRRNFNKNSEFPKKRVRSRGEIVK